MNTLEFLNLLVEQLRRIDGRVSPWGSYTFNYDLHGEAYPRLHFFDEINSFPLVSATVVDERIIHAEGGGALFYSVSVELRGYTYDEAVEESGENISQDIEHVIEHLREQDPRITEVRVLEINTDSGLNAPWGACVIKIEGLFRR